MSRRDRLEQRLAAVERVITDGDTAIDELEELATVAADVDRLEERIETHERRIAALEGEVDALDGFAGNVESVNDAVERQADAAVAAVDRLEYRLNELERTIYERPPSEAATQFAWTDETQSNEENVSQPASARVGRDNRANDDSKGAGAASESASVERTAEDVLSDADAIETTNSSVTADSASPEQAADSSEGAGVLASLRSKLP
ncbi:DUF7310 family coiled-coil domain-containing protein [Natronorubrum sulfidifaciens]|uniref:DUF7310 domain-containing protein n=1 Tax=Natronorubrum sulfidifaciens JCM 14089 TaxID=1230460 RepID=L9WM57_9EURY|nr:hypothetical protein [Natronorubrum sulfidifaciens]ELY49428.1 hypothetical protein C495_00645 [Natronorubrum sulfidifaciens JCM 14089]